MKNPNSTLASDLSPDTNSTRPNSQEKILTDSTARLKLETGFSVRNDSERLASAMGSLKTGSDLPLRHGDFVQKCGEEQLKKSTGIVGIQFSPTN